MPAVYQDPDRIAVLNVASRAFVWKPEVVVGTAVPMEETRQTQEERVAALKAVRAARGEKLENDPEARTLDQLFLDLGLADNPMLKSNPATRDEAYALIREYKDVFSSPECEIGQTNLVEFSIKMEEHAKPV